MVAEVHVATPHPMKSVSSVQIGHASARAAARMGQSSGSRVPSRCRASALNRDETRGQRWPRSGNGRENCHCLAGSLPRFAIKEARCSSASAYVVSGTKNEMSSAWASKMPRTRLPGTARIKMFASRTSDLFGIPLFVAARLADFFYTPT